MRITNKINYSYKYKNNNIQISFVTHTIIGVFTLGCTYKYSRFVINTIIRVFILGYTYNYMSRFYNYTVMIL